MLDWIHALLGDLLFFRRHVATLFCSVLLLAMVSSKLHDPSIFGFDESVRVEPSKFQLSTPNDLSLSMFCAKVTLHMPNTLKILVRTFGEIALVLRVSTTYGVSSSKFFHWVEMRFWHKISPLANFMS